VARCRRQEAFEDCQINRVITNTRASTPSLVCFVGVRKPPHTTRPRHTTATATATATANGDGDGYDSDGYGPGEGYYPDGGYGCTSDLADADAWEYAAELSRN
jgi:hypothetical protein